MHHSDSKALHSIVHHVMILNIVWCFFSTKSIYIFPCCIMLSVYRMNLPNFSGSSMFHSIRFFSFFLFWEIKAPALCFTSLHSLHSSHLLSFPHLIHFIIYRGYRVNSHMGFSLYLHLVYYVPFCITGRLSNDYLYSCILSLY